MGINHDFGLSWAKLMNIVAQGGTIQGAINTVMLFIITYSTTFKDSIPLWAYISAVAVLGTGVLIFIVKIGISGYYRFFSQQSGLARVEGKVDKILKHLDIRA